MPECIRMPCVFRGYSKVLFQELVPGYHVHDDLFIGWASLVLGYPAAIDKLKSAILY